MVMVIRAFSSPFFSLPPLLPDLCRSPLYTSFCQTKS